MTLVTLCRSSYREKLQDHFLDILFKRNVCQDRATTRLRPSDVASETRLGAVLLEKIFQTDFEEEYSKIQPPSPKGFAGVADARLWVKFSRYFEGWEVISQKFSRNPDCILL